MYVYEGKKENIMNLHGQIMNIRKDPILRRTSGITTEVSYDYGHRDARHAAAELAVKADSEIEQLLLKVAELESTIKELTPHENSIKKWI